MINKGKNKKHKIFIFNPNHTKVKNQGIHEILKKE